MSYIGKISPAVGNGLGGLPDRKSDGGLKVKQSYTSPFFNTSGYIKPNFIIEDINKVFVTIEIYSTNGTYSGITNYPNTIPLTALLKDYPFQITSNSTELGTISPPSSLLDLNTNGLYYSQLVVNTYVKISFVEVSNSIVSYYYNTVSGSIGSFVYELPIPIKNFKNTFLSVRTYYQSSGSRDSSCGSGIVLSKGIPVCCARHQQLSVSATMKSNNELLIVNSGTAPSNMNVLVHIVEFQ